MKCEKEKDVLFYKQLNQKALINSSNNNRDFELDQENKQLKQDIINLRIQNSSRLMIIETKLKLYITSNLQLNQ